ncbi:heat shock factor protein 5-like [Guaruba guarouba]
MSSREASSASAQRRRGDTGAPWGAATAPPAKQNSLQGLPHEPWALTMQFCVSETSARPRKPPPCAFLYALWQLVSCEEFSSISWGNKGSCLVVAEGLFQQEVLRKREALEILPADSTSSFLDQLRLHGFRRMPGDEDVGIPFRELQALAAEGPALGQLLFYCHPHFQEDYPNLHKVETMAITAMEQLRAATAPPPAPASRAPGREGASVVLSLVQELQRGSTTPSPVRSPAPHAPGAGLLQPRQQTPVARLPQNAGVGR